MQNVSSRSWADMQGSLQSVINLAGKVQTGPGTDSANYMKQLISNISPSLAASLGIDPSKANDTQEMAKMLARISSAGGYGSDAQMFENIASNPSNKMNPDALRRAAGYVKSLNDQEEVLTRAANDQATHQPLNMQTWYGNTRGQIQAGLDQAYVPRALHERSGIRGLPKVPEHPGQDKRGQAHLGPDASVPASTDGPRPLYTAAGAVIHGNAR